MSESMKLLLGGLLLLVFALSRLAPRFPHVAWLQAFRNAWPQPSEAQRAVMRRRAGVYAGAHLILMGLALPLVYGALEVVFLSDFDRREVAFVLAGSLFCVGLGVTAIWQSRRG